MSADKTKDSGIFNRLPAHILSDIFVLAQNPRAAILNKNMYYSSQDVHTISDFVLLNAKNNKKRDFYSNLRSVFYHYAKLALRESVGILLLRKIKKVKYEAALEMALRYGWDNVALKLFQMYIVVETDTLEIIHKDTAFINENENLDVDINDLLTQKDEEYRFLIDIVTSENFCVRPLVAMSKAWYIMVDCLSDRRYKMALEGLVYISQHPVNLPIAIFEGYNDGIVLSNNKAVIYYFLLGADVVCIAHNFELLKRMLSVSFAANVTLGEIGMFINRLKHSSIWEYVKFIEEYEYENYLNQITFSSCVFYSIKYKRRQFIKHLIGNDTNEIDKQLAFDMSVHFGKCKIATELLAFVEPNYDNINKLVTVAYERNNIELVKELLKNENYTENDIHQHALRTACKNGAFETAQTIINRYPKTVGMVTLLDAIYSGKIELVRLLINLGLNISGPEFRGIKIACSQKNIEMVRFLIKAGALFRKEENNGIPEVCTSNNGEILDILLSDKYNIEKNDNKNQLPLKSVRNLRFEKVLEFLIIYGLDFDRYYYEMVMARFALKDMKGIEKLLSQIELSSDRATNRNMLKCKSRILEIVGHVIKNDSKGLSVNKKGVEHDFHSQVTENMNSLKGKHQKHQFQEFNTTTSVEGGPMNERFSNDQTAKDILDDEHFQAIKAKLLDRDFDLLKLLIENGAPINSHYFLVLRTAFRAGSIKWIDYFISKGARLGTEGYNGVSEACESGEVAVLRYLLKRGAIVDGESQFNGIKIACKLGNLQMVKLLVEKKADLSDPRYNGIKEACESNSLQILKYLLDKKATVGDLHHSGLDKACLTGNIELVKMLIKHKVDLHSPKNNGIKEACKANSLEIVKLLVKSGAKPEDVEYNGICEACENNNFELVNFLIKDGGATVDDNFFCGVKEAAKVGNVNLIRLLLSSGAQINRDYNNGVIEASANGDLKLLQFLFDNGAELNRGEYSGVVQACKKNSIPVLEFLLNKNPNLVLNSSYGIREAFNNSNVEMMKILIRYGANVNSYSGLPLKFAYKKNDVDFVRFLLPFDPVCSKNFLKKLKKIAVGNNKTKGDPNNKRFSISKYLLEHLKGL